MSQHNPNISVNEPVLRPLTEDQKDFIPHILEHVYPEEAAKRVGVNPHILKRWLMEPNFQAELAAQRKVYATTIMHALERYSNEAVLALVDILKRADNDNARIKAADSILTHTLEYKKSYGLEVRLEALEQGAGIAGQVKRSV